MSSKVLNVKCLKYLAVLIIMRLWKKGRTILKSDFSDYKFIQPFVKVEIPECFKWCSVEPNMSFTKVLHYLKL